MNSLASLLFCHRVANFHFAGTCAEAFWQITEVETVHGSVILRAKRCPYGFAAPHPTLVLKTPKGVLVGLTFCKIHSGVTHVYLDTKTCQVGVSTSGLLSQGSCEAANVGAERLILA